MHGSYTWPVLYVVWEAEDVILGRPKATTSTDEQDQIEDTCQKQRTGAAERGTLVPFRE